MSGRGQLQRATRRPHIVPPQSAISSPPLGAAASSTYPSLLFAGTTLLCWQYVRCTQCNSSVVVVCSSSSSFSGCIHSFSSSLRIRRFFCVLLVACLLPAPALPTLLLGLHTRTHALLLSAGSAVLFSPAAGSKLFWF